MDENKNNAFEKEQNIERKIAGENSSKENELLLAKINAEKEVKLARLKNLKSSEKARIREERKEERAAYKSEKLKRKNELKKSRKGFGGYITAVVTLAASTLILSGVLIYFFIMPTAADTSLEATYQKSFYDTVSEVDNMDLSLSKFFASTDKTAWQEYLVDTAVNSELAESNLQSLPLQDENKFYTTKLVNQIGDFSKYLNKKLASGEELTDSDMQSLKTLYRANATLKDTLQKIMGNMGADYSFSSMAEEKNNFVVSSLNELQNLSVSYPELIYDGPFSDGQNDREIKGLNGDTVTDVEADEIFSTIFESYELENIKPVGEAFGVIECFCFQGEKDGEVLYAQISKIGGKLIAFSYAGSCNDLNYDGAFVTEKAQEFFVKLGLTDMKAVWINLANNVYTVNFAYEDNGIIVYSDLVKVRICAETGMIIGLEATSYYTNHTERIIGSAVLTEEEARSHVIGNLQVDTVRLAVVPIGNFSEKLCYEFSGEFDDAIYYVYIDAISGKQVELFKVIESTEGVLLI